MVDFKITPDGDLEITPVGDIVPTESVAQAVLIRLKWFLAEWRLGPTLGFPYFEEVFVKNPNLVKVRSLIRDEIMQVDGVTAAEVTSVKYDKAKRTATIAYTVTVGEEVFKEEVALNG